MKRQKAGRLKTMSAKTMQKEIPSADAPVSQKATRAVAQFRNRVLDTLFPEGFDRVRVWNDILAKLDGARPSMPALEEFADQKYGIRRRIMRHFPLPGQQMQIILAGDVELLDNITCRMQRGITGQAGKMFVVLTGTSPEDLILDFTSMSVLTMMILRTSPKRVMSMKARRTFHQSLAVITAGVV